MGKLKDEKLQETTEDVRTHELKEDEVAYVQLLNLTLQYHTLGQRILSGFLYYVATNRLGYTNGSNLGFEFDLSQEQPLLTVRVLPADTAKAAEIMQEQQNHKHEENE